MTARTPFPYFRLGYALDFHSRLTHVYHFVFLARDIYLRGGMQVKRVKWGWKAIELS